jgi:elongation factor G
VENIALDLDNDEAKIELTSDPDGPLVSLAFKLEEGRYGQLTYVRVYQGTIKKGTFIHNIRTRNKVKVGRLVRMHANQMEDIDGAIAGDIVALFGVDCASGDTFTDGSVSWAMTSMHVPDPVISYTISTPDSAAMQNLSKALQRFTKEDPTFRVHNDAETSETIISGMGELHLDVYLERMRREYKIPVVSSPPQVAYREAITRRTEFNYIHKKQTGGSGQYAKVVGWLEPIEATEEGGVAGEFEFLDKIKGGSIPREFISACEKGFKSMLGKGRLLGVPVTSVRVCINDGNSHSVDSSDIAFQEACRGAWRSVYEKAKPIVMEPLMKVEIEGPAEFHGPIVATVLQRRGMVVGSSEEAGFSRVEAAVPLSEMFGYSTALRSSTQGKAEFSMEFARYVKVPDSISEGLVEEYRKAQKER